MPPSSWRGYCFVCIRYCEGVDMLNGATILIYVTLALAVAVDYVHDRYRRD